MVEDQGSGAAPPAGRASKRHERAIVLGIMALALLLRALGAGTWWLNPDEGIYFDILTAPTAADFWEGVRWNAHPPLYYVLLRAVGALTWDFYWYRALSLVAGCAAVYGFWLCGLELGGQGPRRLLTGTLAALAVAVSPAAVVGSQVMRPYMLLLALLSFSLYLLLRHLRERTSAPLVGYAACLSLALLTHYSAFLAMAVFGALVALPLVRGDLRGRDARRVVAAHALPSVVAGGLYLFHLGPLTTSSLARNALGGWLAPYMPSGAGELWTGLLGFFGMIAGPWLAAPLALLLLAALGWGVWSRSWSLTLLGGVALVLAAALALTGHYPLGGSRHVIWLMPFTVLPIACFTAWGLTSGRRVLRVFLPASVLLLGAGGPLGRAGGWDRIEPAQAERTLRRDDLVRILEPLAALPEGLPVLMNGQTYYMLLPLYEVERRTAARAPDGSFFRFTWMGRDVVVSEAWDLRVGVDQLAAANHLHRLLDRVDVALPELALGDRNEVLILFGGWPASVYTGDIGALRGYESVVGGGWAVPGLELLAVDLAEYTRILSASGG